jgi:integrase
MIPNTASMKTTIIQNMIFKLNSSPSRSASSESLDLQVKSFEFLLRGLWLSGLRLGEALNLTWDMWADGIRVDLSGKFAKLLIPAESEKGGQDRIYPVTPDFAEFLRSVPEFDRGGFVFKPILHRGVCHRTDTVSKAISDIGRAAQVKVDQKGESPIWASAHDLRRAFGFRWSRRVNSMVLKELMRHASVTTTEAFYVGINADETAALLAGLMTAGEVTPTPAKESFEAAEVTLAAEEGFQDEKASKNIGAART